MSEKKYISNDGLNAYEQVAQEQAASNNKGNTDDYSAALLAQQQQAVTDINTAKTQAQTAIETTKTQAIAAVSIVDVGSNENIQHIADNCATWTDGQQYQLPSGMTITYHTTTTYIGNESA